MRDVSSPVMYLETKNEAAKCKKETHMQSLQQYNI